MHPFFSETMIRAHERDVTEVTVTDMGVRRDIDTRADLPDDNGRPSDAVS